MNRKVTSTKLEPAFDAEDGDGGSEYPTQFAPDDIRPVVIFLIPGILSDKVWAHNFRIYSGSSTERRIYPYVVSGSVDLALRDFLFRYRLAKFRRDFAEQIRDTLAQHTDADVNFLCHSMGSSLFADIVAEVEAAIKQDSGNVITNIAFIGSVCHQKHSGNLKRICGEFVNDVGLRDHLSFWAGVINSYKYSPVGRFGFSKTHVSDRFFENIDHDSCTAEEHISKWIVPIFEDGNIKATGKRLGSIGYNRFRYARGVVWAVIYPLLVVGAGIGVWALV